MIHFDRASPGTQVGTRHTYCGMVIHEEPDTDTVAAKVTCGRCKRSIAKELRPKMRVIRVSYRATFSGLKQGALNPIGAQVKVPIDIEIFESTGDHWKFRAPNNNTEITELGVAGGLDHAKKIAEDEFETVVTPWVIIGDAGDGKGRRALSPDEVVIKEGKVYVYEDAKEREERTRRNK